MDAWLQFLPQCCDAHQYQDIGTACAVNGVCYDPLRPMGATLWFSLPVRLGLPFEALIYPNLLLLVLSVGLSALAALRWTQRLQPLPGLTVRLWHGLLLAAASLLVHWGALHSLVFSSLADAPAGLLALNGAWALLLSGGRRSAAWLALAGLLLGLAAWLRVFYLYPVLVLLAAYGVFWLLDRRRRWRELVLLLALLPLSLQYAATWRETARFSFLSPQETAFWTQAHFNSRASGYDTVLPFEAFQWFSGCAVDYGGVQGAWQQRSAEGLACIFWNRFEFYFGSYSPRTYLEKRPLFTADGNILLFRDALQQKPVWLFDRVTVEPDVALAPDGNRSADRVVARYDTAGGGGGLWQGFEPMHAVPHTYSLWLWAPQPVALRLVLRREADQQAIAGRNLLLTPVPTRYSVTGTPQDKRVHLAVVESRPGEAASFGTTAGQAFYAWGAQLERADGASPYYPDTHPEQQRLWSPLLLWAHGLALLGVPLLVWRARRAMTRADAVAALLPMLVLGQAMLVVPEQRFVAVLMVMLWLLVLAAALLAWRRGFSVLARRRAAVAG